MISLFSCRSGPPEVPFARAKRERLVSNLVTNGKAEPSEWVAVHSEVAGEVEKLLVGKGAAVEAGAMIARLDTAAAQAELMAAEARIAGIEAELALLRRGGSSASLAEIDAALARSRLDAQAAEREVGILERLVAKKAATGAELETARNRVRLAEAEIRSLEQKRKVLVDESQLQAASARLREARAGAERARRLIEAGDIRAPIRGELYRLEIRPGSFLQAGQLVAEIGRLDQMHVILYVDEPELGRVSLGAPVKITWDALPDKEWYGAVERLPTRVVALGARQVGEVLCRIENPGKLLAPGANVNAELRSRVVENALTIPKECLRREGSDVGVYVLQGEKAGWRKVRVGVSNVTRAEIVEGLTDTDAVALPSDVALSDGKPVRAIYP